VCVSKGQKLNYIFADLKKYSTGTQEVTREALKSQV